VSPTRLSERSLADSEAPLGYGTARVMDRMLAACGLLDGAALEFTAADDVLQAGVLCALPALLTEGLLRHARMIYALPPGYYPLEAIFLHLALLALVRCRSLEQTRYQAPGEWGRILGLDRPPEVKTLRAKIATLCAAAGRAAQWQSGLAKEWIEAAAGHRGSERRARHAALHPRLRPRGLLAGTLRRAESAGHRHPHLLQVSRRSVARGRVWPARGAPAHGRSGHAGTHRTRHALGQRRFQSDEKRGQPTRPANGAARRG